MSWDVRIIASPPVAAGFRLAGLAPVEAGDRADGVAQLQDMLREPGVGVVLVEEPIYGALPEAARRALARSPVPMVVPFPGPAWMAPPVGPESFIAELLRQAIGYRVKLG